MKKESLRNLPGINELISDDRIAAYSDKFPHAVIAEAARDVVENERQAVLRGEACVDEGDLYETAVKQLEDALFFRGRRSLRRVINATGVVLHTNLGRANLCQAAKQAVMDVADHYSTLEYDPTMGHRGSRHAHLESAICKLTGAEAAMVVNNNAAGVLLCLAALGRGREIIISRGELVEIGGSFRVPEIMEESGAKLVEVGTTNKTRMSDYEKHISEETGALLKVHTSNYKIVGFTEDTSVRQLKSLADKYNLPLLYDLGSGLMADLTEYGLSEPTVRGALNDGADVVLFSGDKLLGGPQAGVAAGKAEYIEMMKKHPLARAFRVDKMTIAAMEATLFEYFDEEKAKGEIPVLAMLTRGIEDMTKSAAELKKMIDDLQAGLETSVEIGESLAGGGSLPDARLKSAVVAVRSHSVSCDELAKKLREGELPIVARIHEDRLIFDVRTVAEDELAQIAEKLGEILK